MEPARRNRKELTVKATIPYSLAMELGADGSSRDDAAIEAVQSALANGATHRTLKEHAIYGDNPGDGYEAFVELAELIPAAEWPEPYVLASDRYDDVRGTVRLATFGSLREAEMAFAAECDLADEGYGPSR